LSAGHGARPTATACAGAHVEAGVRDFAAYAKAMLDEFGPWIRPYLLSFWEGARNYPGLDTAGMTSPEDSLTQFKALNVDPPTAEEIEAEKAFKRETELLYRKMRADPDNRHNTVLHRQIRETWQAHSPKIWAKLTRLGMTTSFAFVCQERMREQQSSLIRGGMNYSDAKYMAWERLLMTPEAEYPMEPEEPPLAGDKSLMERMFPLEFPTP
jgi:hypothetical protein